MWRTFREAAKKNFNKTSSNILVVFVWESERELFQYACDDCETFEAHKNLIFSKTTNSMWYHTRAAYINARENIFAFSVQSDQWTRVVLKLKKLSLLHELGWEIRRRIFVFLFKQFDNRKCKCEWKNSELEKKKVMTRKFHTIFQFLIGPVLLITFCFCQKSKFTCNWTTST